MYLVRRELHGVPSLVHYRKNDTYVFHFPNSMAKGYKFCADFVDCDGIVRLTSKKSICFDGTGKAEKFLHMLVDSYISELKSSPCTLQITASSFDIVEPSLFDC